MNNTKLIQLLKTFSLLEFYEFGKFINSPMHNESPKMIRFYDFLKKHYPEFNSSELTKENIYKKLYESVKYEDKKLRDRFSDMLKLAEEYLALIDFRKNQIQVKRHTLSQFAKRVLRIHFDKKYKEIRQELDKVKIKNNHYFYDEYLHLKDEGLPLENEKLLMKRKHLYDNMRIEIEMFLRFFVSKMLKYYSMMQSMERHLNYKFEYDLFESVMKYVEKNDFDSYPSIKAFYFILKINENTEDDSYFYKLKDLIIKNQDRIEYRDKILIFVELFNNAHIKFVRGKKEFEAERFEIMNLELEYKTYPEENGWMRHDGFLNYVHVALNMEKLARTEKFIKTYLDKVAPEFRDYLKLFSNGLLLFSQKKYDKSLEYVLKIKIRNSDFYSYAKVKTLLSKIYFEQKEYENLLSLVDSFKHYMAGNNLITEPNIRRYTNYINILNKLTLLSLDVNLKKDDYRVIKLIEEINNYSIEELTESKKWLLKKGMELKANIK